MRFARTHGHLEGLLALLLCACSAAEPRLNEAESGVAGGRLPDAGPNPVDTTDGTTPTGLADGQASCARVSTSVGLLPVQLAFAFDVSGSMGKGDKPWHDKLLKWDPVVQAARGFFESPGSQGLSASLTFFPAEGDEDERCVTAAYERPDVAMTALPSASFAAAITEIEPASADDWRGGTPTAWVMRGTRAYIARERAERPGNYAIVLVTDGYPQGCDEQDDSVAAVVAEAEAAQADGVRTYVIGVANPPVSGAPDTVSDLQQIASAGATEQAFLIDTGMPAATVASFASAVQAIREASSSCSLAIPPAPNGQAFDKAKVAVSASGAAGEQPFVYDARCSGAHGWHYDDVANPTQIVLCEAACAELRATPTAMVQVQFACENLILF